MRPYTDEKKHKRAGLIATVIYVAMWVVLIFFVSFNLKSIDLEGEGILIDFGDGDTGLGIEDLYMNETTANVETPASSPQMTVQEEIITQEIEEAPVIAETRPETPRETERQTPVEQPKPAEETPPAEQPREVNQRALFPGRSDSNSQSQGEAGGEGNQGNLAGSTDGSNSGTGLGTNGDRWNLSGRSLIGTLPAPEYNANEEGRVIIEIRVNPQGEVVSTSVVSLGSTTTNRILIEAAERAAKKARFNVNENAPFSQVGTITYNFRIK
ncbi:MAG: TonB family protein [Rikenellaceae bacterium]|nr:TonB family protein [Rikenellaceae bacterium]